MVVDEKLRNQRRSILWTSGMSVIHFIIIPPIAFCYISVWTKEVDWLTDKWLTLTSIHKKLFPKKLHYVGLYEKQCATEFGSFKIYPFYSVLVLSNHRAVHHIHIHIHIRLSIGLLSKKEVRHEIDQLDNLTLFFKFNYKCWNTQFYLSVLILYNTSKTKKIFIQHQ